MSGSGARIAETGSLLNRGRDRRMSTAAAGGGALSTETVPELEVEPDLDLDLELEEGVILEGGDASSPSSVVALGDIDVSK